MENTKKHSIGNKTGVYVEPTKKVLSKLKRLNLFGQQSIGRSFGVQGSSGDIVAAVREKILVFKQDL